jgi:extracellular factor (EF) 3-hydroxypalmitic acid methyl ester biosynthesis protein
MSTLFTTERIEIADNIVSCVNNQGIEMQATVLRLSRYQVVFEIYSPSAVLRMSEVLTDFKVSIAGRAVYYGRAVITSLVNAGTVLVCEVKLEDSWVDVAPFVPQFEGKALRAGFDDFLQQWQKIYRIDPEYKAVVADMHTFLTDMRLWLEQVELGIRSSPSSDRLQLEHDVLLELGQATTSALGALFEKFEAVAMLVEAGRPDRRAAHSAFAKRLLHPLLLASPFLYRTFRKPLGYAGDYEMVNMICRDPLEGSTLFAKVINLWFLRQPPAEAHRNRIKFLVERITEVTARALAERRPARILSIGCGPAIEVQRFVVAKPFADQAQFTLIDFNEETAEHARSALENVKRKHGCSTEIRVIKKSVQQILKESAKKVQGSSEGGYDFVYCAGLFDYLSDSVCRRLSNVLYDWVGPGGLFVSTNVDGSNPRQLTMDYIMDWHLIYRRAHELAALHPEGAPTEEANVTADTTGVNIHYMVRKPKDG